MPARQKNLNDLFLDGLKDIFHAEKQILRTLPKMARAVNSDQLRDSLEKHREETQGQIERLERVFEIIDKRASGKTCQAMQGIVDEGQEILEEFKDSQALDAGVIAANQSVEHYEIARYGTLRTWAQQLGIKEAARLIEQNLEEEKKTDALLTKMAERMANEEAKRGQGEEEEAPKRRAKSR